MYVEKAESEGQQRWVGGWAVVDTSWFECIVAVSCDNRPILTCERRVIAETDCIQAAGPSNDSLNITASCVIRASLLLLQSCRPRTDL